MMHIWYHNWWLFVTVYDDQNWNTEKVVKNNYFSQKFNLYILNFTSSTTFSVTIAEVKVQLLKIS